jgi:hypothetical protein
MSAATTAPKPKIKKTKLTINNVVILYILLQKNKKEKMKAIILKTALFIKLFKIS